MGSAFIILPSVKNSSLLFWIKQLKYFSYLKETRFVFTTGLFKDQWRYFIRKPQYCEIQLWCHIVKNIQ